jgi:hypothetical protein
VIDGNCHPLAFLSTGDDGADCAAADGLLNNNMPATSIAHGDKR